jgi:site-specific recombinase XerD
MTLDVMVKMFLDTRKRGVAGARRKCTAKTVKIYRDNLELFVNFVETECGVTAYEDVKRIHMNAFYDWMDEKVKSKRWSRSTVLQVLRSLRALFHWVDKDEDCRDENLRGIHRWLPTIEKTPRRTDMPEITDVRKFTNYFDTGNRWHYRDYVITCLMLTNGVRAGEVCNLTIDGMKLDELTLIVSGKTGTRLVPITKDMARMLKGWMKRREGTTHADSPYVFVSKRGPKMEVGALGMNFRRHTAKYNLPRMSPHTFRHLFCTHYLKNGGDIEKLRNITGHTSYAMLMDYLHLAKVGGQAAKDELEKVNLLKDL